MKNASFWPWRRPMALAVDLVDLAPLALPLVGLVETWWTWWWTWWPVCGACAHTGDTLACPVYWRGAR
jgi:hypothetical protein